MPGRQAHRLPQQPDRFDDPPGYSYSFIFIFIFSVFAHPVTALPRF
ncbi:MAG: hypothetical protein JXB47_02015 [Anaerolineae bacterium]|nr:hypothetical protein [Anaerolineae bacterium]